MSCPHCEKMKEQREREKRAREAEHEKHAQESHCCCCGGNGNGNASGGNGPQHHLNAGGCCCGGGNAEIASEEDGRKAAARDRIFLLVSLAALILGFVVAQTPMHESWPLFPLTDPSWIAVVLCGWPILRAAKNALLRERKITSALLISIAILASLALQFFFYFGNGESGGAHCGDSYIFAAGEVSFLMALGEMIEGWTLKKSRKGIEALIDLSPKVARRKTAAGEELVRVEALAAGDIVFVSPDDMIPADGVIVSGESSVNQAGLTGESVPVDKAPGDTVLAGTWNRSGALTVRVSAPNADNTISRLIRLVEEAEEKKAPIQHVADRWASCVVPAAIACAFLVALFAYFVLGIEFHAALVRGVTILVVFCPCAFALATPTAIAAGVGNATRIGILIKSGEALEKLVKIDTVVFDKTGTLTRAQLRIEAFFSADPNFSEKESLALAAAAESQSQHPIARAIVDSARGIALPEAEKITARTGVGVVCEIGGQEILVCSFAALLKEKIAVPAALQKFADERRELGETLVCLVADGVPAAAFSLSDTIRECVPATVAALRRDSVVPVMLTGDNAPAARRIAQISGIGEVFSELLPQDKAEKIAALRDAGKSVLMVGDGVNDAPALASADCSIAMGALGSEIAVETADIAFLNDNIALVPGLLRFSKAVLRTIHINFAFSLCINFAAVILSAAGILDPVTGAIVHNASSVLVVSHSALLLFRKKDYAETAAGTAATGTENSENA